MSSELRKQLNASKLAKFSFIPFAPSDNTHSNNDKLSGDEDNSREILVNNEECCSSLLKMNMFLFLSQFCRDNQLQDFVQSYLTYRSRSYNICSVKNELLCKLDKHVFMIFLRLSSPAFEHRLLSAFYPEPQLTVMSKMSSMNRNTEFSEIDSQYCELLSSIQLIQFPHILDVLAIAGDSNKELSSLLLSRFFKLREKGMRKEMGDSINETFKAVAQLTESAIDLFHTVCNKHNSKATQKTIQKSLNQSNNIATTPLDSLYFIVSFAVDIVYTYACWLDAATNTGLSVESSSNQTNGDDCGSIATAAVLLFSSTGTSLSQQYGVVIVDTIKLLYEVILPLTKKIYKQLTIVQNASNTTTADTGNKMNVIDHYMNIIQDKSIMVLDSLLQYSLNACRTATEQCFASPLIKNVTATTGTTDTTLDVVSVDSVSWMDVLQSKLDLQNIKLSSIVVSVEDTDIMIGVLVSDYIRYSEKLTTYNAKQSSKSTYKSDTNLANNNVYKMLCYLFDVHTDSDRIDYIMSSLVVTDTLLLPVDQSIINSETAGGGPQINAIGYSNHFPSLPTSNSGAGNNKNTSAAITCCPVVNATDKLIESYDAIRGIFPDLGEGFIEACLQVYNNSSEQVIDALLMDNLHPRLLLLDRKMNKMWTGKSNTDDLKYTASGSGISGSNKHNKSAIAQRETEKQEKTFKDKLKQRVQQEQKEQEYDAFLIEKEGFVPTANKYVSSELQYDINSEGIDYAREQGLASADTLVTEYNDDYDDQYDDYIPSSKQAVAFKKPVGLAYNGGTNEAYSDSDDENAREPGSEWGHGGMRSGGKAVIHLGSAGGTSGVNKSNTTKNNSVKSTILQDARVAGGFEKDTANKGNAKTSVNVNKNNKDNKQLSASAVSFAPQSIATSAEEEDTAAVTVTGTTPTLSAAAMKRREKKAQAKLTGSSNSGKAYTEETRAEMIRQMTETRRFNSLVKEDETEAAYWESMRNTNRQGGRTIHTGRDSWKNEMVDDNAAVGKESVAATGLQQRPQINSRAGQLSGKSSQQQQQPNGLTDNVGGNRGAHSQARKESNPASTSSNQQQGKSQNKSSATEGKSEESTAEGEKKKYRQKTFDKHHQKDKANRKFGAFTPAI